MKLFRLLIIVPAMLIQIGCGSNSSNPNNGAYYMGANGSCMSTGGQVVPQTYCTSGYGAGGIVTQACTPGTLYYMCQQGTFNPNACTPGYCNGSCSGQLLWTQAGQEIRCQ